jgi:hypothetical protein
VDEESSATWMVQLFQFQFVIKNRFTSHFKSQKPDKWKKSMYQRNKLSKLNFCIGKANNSSARKLRHGVLASILVAGVSVVSTASAEEYVERSGNFAIPMPTPKCDGVGDFFNDVADSVVDGVEYLGEKTLKAAEGMGELLLTGNPDALIDEVNQTFEDAASAAASLSKYTPLALISVIVDVLPEGSVTTFLKRGAEFEESLRAAVASGVVSGLNPITLKDTVINDLDEIGGDLLKVLVKLDDPLSAGNEFLKLNQKWNAAGALTYMFTEGDPITGMKKALNAMHRQIELVTTYAGPNGKVAAALLNHSMQESKKFIDALPEGEDKKVAALFAATFAVTFKTQLSDPNFNFSKNVSRHPLYSAELRSVNTKWMGDDHNSKGDHDWGFSHPIVEDKPGCISLGDYAYPDSGAPKRLNAICNVEEGRNEWWSRPVDYKLVWGDNCSGATHSRSVWQPVCEEGYTSVGFVASGGSWERPLPNQIACLKNDIDVLGVTSGKTAGLKWVASDENSGAKYDGTFYNRNFLGMQLMYAVPKILSKGNPEYQQWKVPVPVSGQAPSYDKAHCVNFYTEPDFKGWTHEACRIDTFQALQGNNDQMFRDGISSFQCGEEVAAVELRSDTLGNKIFYCDSDNNNYLGTYDNFGLVAKTYSSYTTSLGNTILSPVGRERRAADKVAAAEALAAAAEALRVAPVLFEFTTASTDVGGRGTGTVEVSQAPTSQVGGNYYTPGDVVILSAIPTERSEFQGWSGDAASCGTNSNCEITFVSYTGINVRAVFTPKPTLSVFNVGGGSLVNGTRVPGGTINISPQGLACNNADYTCLAYASGQQVSLTATAQDGTVFDGWRGDDDCIDGNVNLNSDLRCEGVFKYTSYQLTVANTAGVEISSDPVGEINCGSSGDDCAEVYQVSDGEQTRVLRAVIDPDYTFVRWSGLYDCYDEDEKDNDPLSIRVKVGAENVQCNVVAVPAGTEYALTIEKLGGGEVSAEAIPSMNIDGIDCSLNACSQLYPVNTQVQLTAVASRGTEFIGFKSIDVGSDDYQKEDDDCIDGQINMIDSVSCTASFKTQVLVVDGTPNSNSKEQDPFISVLRNQDLVDYDIWQVNSPSSGDNSTDPDTGDKRVEPVAEDLAKYGRVIWYTQHASQDYSSSSPLAGPSETAEGALAEYLDGGGCLLLSSPEYYKDRGLTPFMQNYLGVAEITSQDVEESYVKGAGEARLGFNELTGKDYLSVDKIRNKFFADAMSHNQDMEGADVIFTYRESGEEAAIALDNGRFRSMFFGFPFTGLSSGTTQNKTMRAFLDFCGQPDSDDAFEVNDDLDLAVERSGNVEIFHLRILPDNDDYFKWTSNWYADTTVSINFTHIDGDLSLALYDGNGALISMSQSQSDGEELTIEGVNPDEYYFVRVYGASASETNIYSLSITQVGGNDFDHDGVPDANDLFPEDPSEQYDNDGDLIGDNADPDDDNDVLPDAYELANGFDPLVSSDTFEDDADDDGYSDFSEYLADTDPNDASSTPPELALAFFLVDFGRVRNDVDGDGKSDLLWRSEAKGWNFLWAMDGVQTKQARPINVVQDDGWLMAGQGDYDADGKSDILWRNTLTGLNFIYLMDGLNIKAKQVLNYVDAPKWELRGSGDFNGDGKGDVLWRNVDRGDTWFYMMDGLSIGTNQPSLWVTDLNYKIAAIGDINGDGTDDVIWRNQVTGVNYIWIMQDGQIANRYVLNTIDAGWTIGGAGDLDGDGTDDIILRNQVDGRNWAYLMENGQIKASELINTVGDTNWQIANMGDYDGDGKTDILWRNESAARNIVHLMDGLSVKAKGVLRPTDNTWTVAK